MDKHTEEHLAKWIEANTYSYSDRETIRQLMIDEFMTDAEYHQTNNTAWTRIFQLAGCERHMDPQQ